MNKAKRNGECKFLINKDGALGLRRRKRILRRTGENCDSQETINELKQLAD